MSLGPTSDQCSAIDRMLDTGDATAGTLFALIRDMVLEEAAKACESKHDTFAQTEGGQGINRGAAFCAAAVRSMMGTKQ